MWTPTTRQQHSRTATRYQTDLTDAEWRVIAPHLPNPCATGRPREWPMRYSVARWSVTLAGLRPGAYEFRVRSVDLNGFAQPEPRPYPKSGRNEIQYRSVVVMG